MKRNTATAMGNRISRVAGGRGMTRRRFLRLSAAGGTAAALAACVAPAVPAQAPPAGKELGGEAPLHFKDATPFIDHGEGNLETRLANMEGWITSNRHFFVRNNSASLDLDADAWRLRVEGDAVERPLELSYSEIRALPSLTLVSYLECAGNQRAMFDLVKGQPAQGTQWGTGAVSNGEWTGAPLRDALKLAGIAKEAVSVLLIGLDKDSPEEGFRRVMPVEKAMDRDTLLAYALNGEKLPRDHGFPLRALAPGWVGSASIKWLGRIVVSSKKLWTRNNTTSYTLIGDDYRPEGESLGAALTQQTIKSALALPWPAQISSGERRIYGYAHSPAGPVARVDWSLDSGETWNASELLEPQAQYSWARFAFTWSAEPGTRAIMTRATDVEGNTQPDEVPFNQKGYLFNQPLPHPILVT